MVIAFWAAARSAMFSSKRIATGWPMPTTSPSTGLTYGMVRWAGELVAKVICLLAAPPSPVALTFSV
ncbi:hypothetical protein PICSAR216_04565 [Mycobacterium avium subsp. paratuberculosis]|nr:hypothetical protein PICSAR216_04565 [Mycobacterium avium subsp. paratuberculosis]